MISPSWALQLAIHDRLSGDAALRALLGGPAVFDHVPRGAAVPYVTFGAACADDWSTDETTGASHTLILHVWSRATGRSQALAIAAAITDALARTPLDVDGHRLVLFRHEASDFARQADGETLLATLRFKALTEPAT
jgi:hypothetical protein